MVVRRGVLMYLEPIKVQNLDDDPRHCQLNFLKRVKSSIAIDLPFSLRLIGDHVLGRIAFNFELPLPKE